MKLTREQLEKVKEFAKKHISKNDSTHGISHIEDTVKYSIIFAKKEKADINKSIVIAWLHDIAKRKEKEGKNHGDKGAKMAKEFLEKLNFSKKDIKEICYAIQQHNKGGKKKTIEASIIWDADKIQAIGPHGFLRSYEYNLDKGMGRQAAYEDTKEEEEFFTKRFRTKSGQKIAKKQYKFMKKFHKNYLKIKNGDF